jgi:hypothetical protein
MRQSIPNSIDLPAEFCKLQGLLPYRLHNYQEIPLRPEKRMDPVSPSVDPNLKIASIQNGHVEISERIYSRATGEVLILQTVTCETKEALK